MNLALWIVATVLAASFAGSGLMKLLVPKDKLVSSGQGWAQDVTPTNIRLIGVVEVLGAAGLILPAVTPCFFATSLVEQPKARSLAISFIRLVNVANQARKSIFAAT